ncbi:MAG TPA: hypothetical protein VFW94_01840 [Candidatus Acidoferrales bacterium]|nr:hypothetical protein [Candidatus Acidoferrales bacterium]
MIYKFPTAKEVDAASREQLAAWYRGLVATADDPAERRRQIEIMNRIKARFTKLGGMTPALSKKVGF